MQGIPGLPEMRTCSKSSWAYPMSLACPGECKKRNPKNRQGLERFLASIDEIILGGYGSIAEKAADQLVMMGMVQTSFAARLATKMGVGAIPVDADWVRAVVDDPFDGQLLCECGAKQRVSMSLGGGAGAGCGWGSLQANLR